VAEHVIADLAIPAHGRCELALGTRESIESVAVAESVAMAESVAVDGRRVRNGGLCLPAMFAGAE
jgi:hypothetical protein